MKNDKNLLEEISRDDLPLKSWVGITWALYWRGIIVTIGALLLSILIGGFIGLVTGMICRLKNFPFESIKVPFIIFCYIVGFGIGFSFFIFQVKWFFKANFSNFRIAILKKNV